MTSSPGMDARRDRVEDRLGAAGRDGDLGVRIVAASVVAPRTSRRSPRAAQHALHRRVLIAAGAHVARDRIDQRRIAVEVRKPLRQVDRAEIRRQARHDREDRGADRRQPGLKPEGRGSIRPQTPSKQPVALFFRTAFQGKCWPFIAM